MARVHRKRSQAGMYLMCWMVGFLLLLSSGWSKVYDCFLFLNEWELLEIRLNELNNHVDYFVLIEAAEGFRGHPKAYHFEENKQRYAPFLDKIIHIKLSDSIFTEDPWVREFWQRNQIMQGLIQCEPEDLILISDIDEFIPGSIIATLYTSSATIPIIGFHQKMYRFFINRTTSQLWAGTAALRYKHLSTYTPQDVRNLVRQGKCPLWEYGWHFTSMGGYERNKYKHRHYSHGGDDSPVSRSQWREIVNAHPLVPIDKTYPQFVQENRTYLQIIGLIDTYPVYYK